MDVIEMQMVSYTLGRRTALQQIIGGQGIRAGAEYLRGRGYSLAQTLKLIKGALK